MRRTAHIAAMHSALWSFDRTYRLAWYVWPAALAILISGWICIDKTGGNSANSWAKPTTSAPAIPVRRSPTLASWPEKLQDDVTTCFSNAVDLNPLIAACTRLIESGQANDGQLVSAYNQRGFLQRLSQPDRALDDYNAALKLQPNSPQVLTNRAYIYLTRTRNDDAMADLSKAIDLYIPANAGMAHYYRGYDYFRLRDYDHAREDLDEAIKRMPSNPDPYLTRGDVELAQQQYDAALKDYDEFSKRAPRDPRGLIGRGEVLDATGRLDEAIVALNSAVNLAPNNARALAARDKLLAKQRDEKK
jgi:tetratricopeptide (TPR) repeat protein